MGILEPEYCLCLSFTRNVALKLKITIRLAFSQFNLSLLQQTINKSMQVKARGQFLPSPRGGTEA